MSARVRRVEAIPLRYALAETERYGSSRGLVSARETTLVRIETSDGAVGWGEAFGPTAVLVPLVNEAASAVIDAALDAPAPLVSSLLQGHYHWGAGLYAAAVSGIEIALWDVLGRSLGVSVSTLLGGRAREYVTPYASCGYVKPDRDIGRFVADLERDSDGMAGAKIKCGLGVAEDRMRSEAARTVLGPARSLMVDFNGNYTADESMLSMHAISDLNVAWVEEPLAPEDVAGLRLLRLLGQPLATGEALYTRSPFRALITERLVDFVQPDVTKVGGLAEAKTICEIARSWGVRVTPHVWGGGIALAAAVQLLGSIPDYPHTDFVPEPLWLEFDRGDSALRENLLSEPFHLEAGLIRVPNGSGLGVDVDELAVERLREDR